MVNPDCIQGMDFVDKFMADFENLSKMGFERLQILKMLGIQDYVKDFTDTPKWLVSAKKLPKGYKWSDDTKFQKKGGKKDCSITYYFLIVEENLYIKNLLDNAYVYEWSKNEISEEYGCLETNEYYKNILDKRICVIKNWKSKKSHKVVYALDAIMTPFLNTCICNFWNDNGGKMSMQEDNEMADILAQKMFGEVENAEKQMP